MCLGVDLQVQKARRGIYLHKYNLHLLIESLMSSENLQKT